MPRTKEFEEFVNLYHGNELQESSKEESSSTETTGERETLLATEDLIPTDPEIAEHFKNSMKRHSFAQNPVAKMALVSCGVGAIVLFLMVIYSLTMTPREKTAFSEEAVEEMKTQVTEEEGLEQENKQLQAALALADEKRKRDVREAELARLEEEEKNAKAEEASAEKEAENKTEQRTATRSRTAKSPRRSTVARRPSTQQRTVPTERTTTQRTPQRAAQRVQTSKEIDPNKALAEVATAGVLSAKGGAEPINVATDEGNTTNTHLVAGEGAGPFLDMQKVRATIAGSVVAEQSTREVTEVQMVLEDALVGMNGEILVPEGATIFGEISFSGSMVRIVPTMMGYETNDGGYMEVKLSPNYFAVSGENGAIVAQRREISQDDSIGLGQIMNGAAAVAGIFSENARDYAALSTAVNGGQRSQRRTERPIVFYQVDDGLSVMFRVTRPAALPVSDTDNEFDHTVPLFNLDYSPNK